MPPRPPLATDAIAGPLAPLPTPAAARPGDATDRQWQQASAAAAAEALLAPVPNDDLGAL